MPISPNIAARNDGGPFEFIVDEEATLASIVNPQTGQFALALSEGSIWYHTGTAWTAIGGSGGAPTNADYLVGTANGSLSAEIVVGTTPGGELGGTWDTPTVDATHSGSSHAATQSAAEATAAAALTTHEGAADPHAGYLLESLADAQGDLLLASGADAWARLAISASSGDVLTSNGTTASWQPVGAASHPGFASHAKFGVD